MATCAIDIYLIYMLHVDDISKSNKILRIHDYIKNFNLSFDIKQVKRENIYYSSNKYQNHNDNSACMVVASATFADSITIQSNSLGLLTLKTEGQSNFFDNILENYSVVWDDN